MSFPWKYRLGTVGQEVPGFFTKLDNPDQDGNGEICMAGRHVFMGYLNEEAKTRETFDDDGYLHSGDVGKRDDKGFLGITGRIKGKHRTHRSYDFLTCCACAASY